MCGFAQNGKKKKKNWNENFHSEVKLFHNCFARNYNLCKIV